jgi:hypothetical protein
MARPRGQHGRLRAATGYSSLSSVFCKYGLEMVGFAFGINHLGGNYRKLSPLQIATATQNPILLSSTTTTTTYFYFY